jgi:FKBP-type peptidyl-prolyl cis-trans isomerase
MRKLETLTRCSALLSFALLSTACFTPADFGAGVVTEEGDAVHGDPAHGDVALQPVHEDEANVIEGIQAGTEGVKLTIKLPEIPYEAPFDGKPLSSTTLESGITVEDFVLGDGDVVADNMVISFSFKGYSAATGQPVMGSRGVPTKLMVNEATRSQDPIAKALIDGLQGMKKGGKRRITVPAEIVEENAPPGRPAIGNLYMAVELVDVAPVPVLHGIEAFSGEPISTKKRSNGLEIYDYVAGEGEPAKAGDQVVVHYIGQLTDGSEFDSSHGRAEGLPAVVSGPGTITGFAQGLEGAKVGMLRKIVVPPEIGYGATERPKIPANSTLVFHLQVMSVTPGSGAQQDMIVPRNGAEHPAGDKPAGDKPAGDKPPKPPKAPKPAEGDGSK